MSMGEIYKFPSGEKITGAVTIPDIIKEQTKDFAAAIADDFVVRFITELDSKNLKVSDNDLKEFGFFIEALRGLINKISGAQHPMHHISSSMMKIVKDKNGKAYAQISYPLSEGKIERDVDFEGDPIE
jgi:hypothetical protein